MNKTARQTFTQASRNTGRFGNSSVSPDTRMEDHAKKMKTYFSSLRNVIKQKPYVSARRSPSPEESSPRSPRSPRRTRSPAIFDRKPFEGRINIGKAQVIQHQQSQDVYDHTISTEVGCDFMIPTSKESRDLGRYDTAALSRTNDLSLVQNSIMSQVSRGTNGTKIYGNT